MIPTQFEGGIKFYPPRSNLTGLEILVKLGANSLYASLVKLGIIPMNSTGIYLNGFTPNSTGQILPGINYWSNGVEIHCMLSWSNLVVIISMDLLPIWPVEFDRSVKFDQALNTGQIGCKFIVCLPGRIGYHPNEFNWHLSQWIYSQFDRSNLTGQIGCKSIEITLPVKGHISVNLHNLHPIWPEIYARSNLTDRSNWE